MNNLTINQQFVRSQQTHHNRRLHRIELRGEHYNEDERERERDLANHYGPIGPAGTTHTSPKVRQGLCRSPP